MRPHHAVGIGLLAGVAVLCLTGTFHWAYLAGVGTALYLYLRASQGCGERPAATGPGPALRSRAAEAGADSAAVQRRDQVSLADCR